MRSAAQILAELRVEARSSGSKFLTLCPQCSHLRRKKRERCLSVNIERTAVLYFCHHCGWKGAEFFDAVSNPKFDRSAKKPSRSIEGLYR
jgi:predicted RNA-binding Zn-ribbon protein involved in translation (DUF1610 family)